MSRCSDSRYSAEVHVLTFFLLIATIILGLAANAILIRANRRLLATIDLQRNSIAELHKLLYDDPPSNPLVQALISEQTIVYPSPVVGQRLFVIHEQP